MEHKVSSYDERRLTNAIERAATVVSVNENLNPNDVLVQQLKKASIDPKFAKTAAQAFNKRLTVFTLRKTADEHKAEDFPLADPDTVYTMMTGKEVKTAAVNFAMTIEQLEEAEAMDKAASLNPNVTVRDKRFEHLCTWDTFKKRLEHDMDKLASAFVDIQADLMRRENAIDNEAQAVANYFKKAAYNFDFTTAVNLYGDKLKAAIGHLVDSGVSFRKTASFVIRPRKDIFDKVASLISDIEDYEAVKWFAQEFATGLAEFAKSAALIGTATSGSGSDLNSQIVDSTESIAGLNKQIKQLKDQLNEDATSGVLGARLGGLSSIVAGTAAGFGEGAVGAINDISGAARTALNNAKSLYYAGNNVSISPNDLLDAAFLTKDRYRDRLLAWSDMSADPQLSMYPAEQVFAATQKAMDMDTSMERPDQREVLRAYVSQLLAQNNRVSTADIAALASTLKELAETRKTTAIDSAKAVEALSDKTEPGRVDQDAIVGQFSNTKELEALKNDANKSLEDSLKQLDEIGEKQRKIKEDELKELVSNRDNTQKALQKMLETKEKREYEEGKLNGEAAAKQLEASTTQSIARSLGFTWVPTKGGKGFYVFSGGKNRKNPVDDSYLAEKQDRNVLTISQMEAIANDIRNHRSGSDGEATDENYLPPGAIKQPKQPKTPPTPPTGGSPTTPPQNTPPTGPNGGTPAPQPPTDYNTNAFDTQNPVDNSQPTSSEYDEEDDEDTDRRNSHQRGQKAKQTYYEDFAAHYGLDPATITHDFVADKADNDAWGNDRWKQNYDESVRLTEKDIKRLQTAIEQSEKAQVAARDAGDDEEEDRLLAQEEELQGKLQEAMQHLQDITENDRAKSRLDTWKARHQGDQA